MTTSRSTPIPRHRGSRLSRLGFVLGLVAIALVGIVAPRGVAQMNSDVVHQYPLRLDGPSGPSHVIVTFPRQPGHAMHPPGTRWPVVVALHGLGEAEKGPVRGSLGWNQDYRLTAAYAALLRGTPLTAVDFGGLVRPARLARINAELASKPFQGVAVVTPYVPSLLGSGQGAELRAYEDWLAGPMLEAVREAYPDLAHTAAGTGIDGVSMGGRVALETGFRHPESFGMVGGIQAAIRDDVPAIAALADRARAQRIRLLSSDDDPYLVPTRQLSDALRQKGVPHDLIVVPGPHGYEFNRGPGSIELLRFGEAALAREPVAN